MARSYNANTDRDAGSRDTVARKTAAPAKATTNKGPVQYAGKTPSKAPVPTPRPNASTFGTSGGPQSAKKPAAGTFGSSGGPQSAKNYTPGSDSQYAAYSSGPTTRGPGVNRSGNPQNVGGFAANARSKSDLNNAKQAESRYNSDAAVRAPMQGPTAPKKKFSSTGGFQSTSKYTAPWSKNS